MRQFALLLATCLVLPLASCDEPEPDPIHVLVEPQCEGTNPRHCMLPWPSSRWLEEADTETGVRLAYDADAMPLNMDGDPFDVDAYRIRDGFSPASTILTTFAADVDTDATAGLALEGLDPLSLELDSPTVLLDLETGERIAHWVEVDARAHEDDAGALVKDAELFYLRPSARLQEDRSYAVAYRNFELIDGTDAEAFPAFAALRDDVLTDVPLIEDRRASYEQMFAAFDEAGIDRASLVQATRFHTASGANIWGDLLAMRDDAMDRVPVGGGECTVEEVQDNVDGNTFRRIDGTFTVPLYMDGDRPGDRVVRGADGRPEFQGWAEAPFTVLIPNVLAEPDAEPGRMLHFGHGLMGSAEGEGGGGYLRGLTNRYGMVSVATDWWGMSLDDVPTVAMALANVSGFPTVGERLMQGVVNNLVMTRSFKGACRTMPEMLVDGEPVIDEGEAYFLGISQGGIMGATTMALSQEMTKAALLVGAANYPLMAGRSINFDDYEAVFVVWYHQRIDREILMSIMISMWDHAEPNAFLPHLVADPLPDTHVKQILYQVSRTDAQVPNVASDYAVRTMGIPLLDPPLLEIYDIDVATGPLDSAYVYYDFGIGPPPMMNIAPVDNEAHNNQRNIDSAKEQMNAFWQPDGAVINFCDGACDPE
jgi:hypothetical protein